MLNRMRSLWPVGVVALAPVVGCQAPPARPTIQAGSEAAPVQALSLEPPSDPLHPWLRLETTLGDIIIELDVAEAPTTVINFVEYAEGGEYDGTIFHRVVPGSILQGGGYTPDLEPKPRTVPSVIPDNWHIELESKVGTVALIRQSDYFGKTSPEFFINLRDNVHHNMGRNHGRFAVFGRVVAGHETINRIRNTSLGTHPKYANGLSPVVPVVPVIINSARLISPFDAASAYEVIALRNPEPKDAVAKLFGRKVADALVETGSGLMLADITVGDGPRSPGPDDVVEFQYRGTFLNGNEFESTYDKRKPALLNMSLLKPGLREALSTMTEGGHRVAVVPPELAYGVDGIPGVIPPSTTLIFELDLLEIK